MKNTTTDAARWNTLQHNYSTLRRYAEGNYSDSYYVTKLWNYLNHQLEMNPTITEQYEANLIRCFMELMMISSAKGIFIGDAMVKTKNTIKPNTELSLNETAQFVVAMSQGVTNYHIIGGLGLRLRDLMADDYLEQMERMVAYIQVEAQKHMEA